MENEVKNAEKTTIGQARPKFQQGEPAEIDEADLQDVAGGAVCCATCTGSGGL